MGRRGLRERYHKEAMVFLHQVIKEKPLLPFLIPVFFLAWVVERWIVPLSNWLPLAAAVWVTLQYGRFQQQSLAENLNRKWEQVYMNRMLMTPLEPCMWLNKLLLEVWSNYMEPKISIRMSSLVENRLKNKRPRLLERISLQEFHLGSIPPNVGLNGAHWFTSGDQRILRMGFDWVTNDISILLAATLAKPLTGTARIVVNSLRMKGNLLLTPILDGQAVLYSFEAPPEVKVGVAFGSGGSHELPATELPGVSSWLVKLLNESLAKIMVEPRRGCFSLPPIDLRKQAVGCVLSVKVVSASKLSPSASSMCNASISRQTNLHEQAGSNLRNNKSLQTFIEVEIGELTRRTDPVIGLDPTWDKTFNMVLHGTSGILKFNLYNLNGDNFDYLTSCEIKMKYVADDSTTFWAIGPASGVIAKQAQYCGKEVEMNVPFEGMENAKLMVKLVLSEWQFSDGPVNLKGSLNARTQQPIHISRSIQLKTGKKIKITILEGRNLAKSAKSDFYAKLQYGKVLRRTKTALQTANPVWNETFEFDEIIDGGYLKIKCFSNDLFGDESMGSAQLNIDGISETARESWIPLEKVSSGELRIRMEAVASKIFDAPKNSNLPSGNGWIELVLVEARELIAADLRGTSDPYVKVQYGSLKKRTKVVYKTLNPQWHQTLEFPDTRSPLILDVRDYNALLPTASIGNCMVEYENLPPNQMADKWIPLQGVKKGEIHIKITRKFPEMEKRSSLDNNVSSPTKATQISGEIRELLKKFHALLENGDVESLSMLLNEIENAEDFQEDYMMQLEKEKSLLLDKINSLGQEIIRSSHGSMQRAQSQ